MIQVYTGDGKGKTTAAIGLAIRALGAKRKVYIGQFIKGRTYNELLSFRKFKDLKVEQFGRGCFIKSTPCKEDIDLARKGLSKIHQVILSNEYDLVILDEVNVALDLRLIDITDVLKLINDAPEDMELVLTGRGAPTEIIERADLVSEIKEVKHYFANGVKARKGIEY